MDFTGGLLSALRGIVNDVKWSKIGTVDELKEQKVTKLYADLEDDEMVIQPDEVLLFHIVNNEFYAIDCSCPHAGGSLELGDIEDINGELSVICPWHSYDFSLKTGHSSTGLKTNVYEIKVVDNFVYIRCDHKLSKSRHDIGDSTQHLGNGEGPPHKQFSDISDCSTLSTLARLILNTAAPSDKVSITQRAFNDWQTGVISEIGCANMPDEPKRLDILDTKEPGKIKRGKGGTLKTRIAILHFLANIEQWAIDLAWDIIGRFSYTKVNQKRLPTEFFADFLKVANDEAKHYTMIEKRLKELGSYFGELPVHNGLWQSAQETAHDLLARLAIVHMVHEARGLDVQPKTAQRFLSQNDRESFELLTTVYHDEITHVACGMKWFNFICINSNPPLEPISTFHSIVKKHFKGYLKPPFNTEGRTIAGMSESWYIPLTKSA